MDQKISMENIFQKLGDLKSFFVYGQKLIPILQKILDFMQDTVPLLENVNRSIQESTSKMPKAALQINSVTNATEVATTEILDIVDGMAVDVQGMQSKLESLKKKMGDDDDIASLLTLVAKIQERMMNITISLQVQDITAQQLSSVNHLIQSIQEKLGGLLTELDDKENNELTVDDHQYPRDAAFNANARYDKNTSSQELVDTLVADNLTKASQAEIDKLFAKQ
jgi:chemotaxis regulatin CheY-phosphate phosphatase CheZ